MEEFYVLTWEAKKEAIFEMPVGSRMRRDARDAKDIRDLAFERSGRSTVGSRSARDADACFVDTDD